MIDATLPNLFAWSLQVLSLVLIAGPLPWLLRLHAPGVRHLYWRVLLAACVILPLVQPWHPVAALDLDSAPPAIEALGPAVAGLPIAPAARVSALLPDLTRGRGANAIAVLLIGGASLRLVWLVAGLVRLRRLRRTGERPAAEDEDEDLAELTRVGAEVRYVYGLRQPVTFGVLRPVVLLPRSLRSQPPSVRRAVCVHERWHVRRRDWLWVVIEETARAVLWFHPAIAWLLSRVQLTREEVVDELTVLTTNARRSYLEALLVFADEPRIYPATPFARRRHLFERMLLISREAVMSSRRIVASSAVMSAVVIMGGWYGVAAFPLQAPTVSVQRPTAGTPRDLRPGEPRPASNREAEIRSALNAGPPSLALYMELAKLQEARGAARDAEATLMQARAALPTERGLTLELANLYNRTGEFDKTIDMLEEAAGMAPGDPSAQHLVATFYEEKIRKDFSLSPGDRLRYVQAGIAAEDRALASNAEYVDAMIVKNILMRHQANAETNAAAKAQLIAGADALRTRAIELQKSRQLLNGQNRPTGVPAPVIGSRMPPPPPPPPPPSDPSMMVDGQAPVRVGGNVKVPTKLVNVPPVYPPDALANRVQGVIIIEAMVDAAGMVREAKVLRSIPMLDQAAVDAVKQWQFTETLLNGQPVPVIMTVTVNFTLQ